MRKIHKCTKYNFTLRKELSYMTCRAAIAKCIRA